MASRNQRINSSKTSVKCGQCKKGVKEGDGSAIGCESCQIWFHGTCAYLSEEEVKWLGAERNYVWLCDSCVEQNDNIFISSKTEAKLNALFDSLSNNFTSSIAELILKLLKSLLLVIYTMTSKNLLMRPYHPTMTLVQVAQPLSTKILICRLL